MAYSNRRQTLLSSNQMSKMMKAVIFNDATAVKYLVEMGEDPNETHLDGRTLLHLAAFMNHVNCARVLLEHNARPDAPDSHQIRPLHRACERNHSEIVKLLLEWETDVKAVDRNFQNALHVCAANNSVECAQLIYTRIKNIDASDRNNSTALHHAVFNQSLEMVQFLLSIKASPNCIDCNGRRPIHYAAVLDSIDSIKLLVEAGAEVTVRDKDMRTPLHLAAARGRTNAITALIQYGANIDAIDIEGNTALHLAALHGHDDPIDVLISCDAKINALNHNSITPLHLAAAGTRSQGALEALLRHSQSLDVNAVDKYGRTPICLAAKFGRLSGLMDLIRSGGLLGKCDKNQRSPLHYGAMSGALPVVEALITHGCDVNCRDAFGMTPLFYAAFNGSSLTCQKLIECGANLSEMDSCKRTAHFLAAFSGNIDCLSLFYPFPITTDISGRSILHYAACSKSLECLQFVCSKSNDQLNIDAADHSKRTPLHFCAFYDENGSMVEYMLNDMKANPCALDLNNLSPVHYAASSGSYNGLQKMLLEIVVRSYEKIDLAKSPSAILLATVNGNVEALNELLENEQVTDPDSCVDEALLIAIERDDINCFKKLIDYVINSDKRFSSNIERINVTNRCLFSCASFCSYECLSFLLRSKPFYSVRDDHGRTPLMIAALQSPTNNTSKCIDLLIGRNFEVNAEDKDARTPIFYAIASGNENRVINLIHRGANPLHSDKLGKTPLHLAAALDQGEVVRTILEGINVDTSLMLLRDKERMSPIHWAAFKGAEWPLNHLLRFEKYKDIHGGRINPFHLAARSGSRACIDLLVTHFGEKIVYLVDEQQRSALHYACDSPEERLDVVNYLIEKKVDVNQNDANSLTCLMLAIKHNHLNVVKVLLENGADPKMQDAYGNTALHLAALHGCEDIGIYLIENYSYLINNNGRKDMKTPLHIAAAKGLIQLVETLLLNAGDVDAVDNNGYAPYLSCTPNPNVAECLQMIVDIMFLEKQKGSELNKTAETITMHNTTDASVATEYFDARPSTSPTHLVNGSRRRSSSRIELRRSVLTSRSSISSSLNRKSAINDQSIVSKKSHDNDQAQLPSPDEGLPQKVNSPGHLPNSISSTQNTAGSCSTNDSDSDFY